MYLSGRTVFTNREAPLLDVAGQGYVHYFKGGVAMYTLRDPLGARAVNEALRRFRERYSAPNAPAATSHALYAELRRWCRTRCGRCSRTSSSTSRSGTCAPTPCTQRRTAPAPWGVTLYVNASKVRADSVGKQTPIPMDDLVEVGVFTEGTGNPGDLGETLYLQQHRIHSGKQTMSVVVLRRPAHAGIDPYRKFIERERDDNVAAVGSDTTRSGGS